MFSFAGCVTPWLPSPCDRLSRLRVLWSHLTPEHTFVGLGFLGFPTPFEERFGSPKFFSTSLRACHGLIRPRQVPGITSFTMPSHRLPRLARRRHLLIVVTRLNPFRNGAPSLTACAVPCVRLRRVVRHISAPPQRQHSVRAVDDSLPGRDSHPARGAKLILAHASRTVQRVVGGSLRLFPIGSSSARARQNAAATIPIDTNLVAWPTFAIASGSVVEPYGSVFA